MLSTIPYRRDGTCPLTYTVIRKLLKYIHDDVRYTLTRYGLDDRPRQEMLTMMVPVRERLSIHAILNARLMEYYKDVLLGQSFRERLWVIVESNIAYNDISPWLSENRCPRVYNAKTVKTANEYGICRYSNGVYEGDYYDGEKNGQGKLSYTSGDIYEGEWRHDIKHGHGQYYYVDGDFYEGDWAVQFIDLDWVCRIGEGKYPLDLNYTTVRRPKGARPDAVILCEHDLQQVDIYF